MVGGRVELDLAAVRDRVGDQTAERLGSYWAACRRFWNRAATTGAPQGAAVRIERLLLDVRQDTGRAKQDLTVQLDALRQVPELAAELRTLLDEHPAGERQVQLWAPRGLWGAELGGAPSSGELRRRFTIDVRYAGWRDRPGRRLARVQVHAEELWPDPDLT